MVALMCVGQNDGHILNNDSVNWILEEERGDLFSGFALHKKANLEPLIIYQYSIPEIIFPAPGVSLLSMSS